ncbi:MAG: hypothetical protein JOZ65_06790 [Chloroflexi bacterium]|nr:hypothetical protein [Chloroflexota bacterium]
MPIDVIQVMRNWLDLNQQQLEALGTTAVLSIGNPERTPRSAWIDFENSGFMGRVIAWERGDTEAELASLRAGEIRAPIYREIQSPSELEEILASVMRAVSLTDVPSDAE